MYRQTLKHQTFHSCSKDRQHSFRPNNSITALYLPHTLHLIHSHNLQEEYGKVQAIISRLKCQMALYLLLGLSQDITSFPKNLHFHSAIRNLL